MSTSTAISNTLQFISDEIDIGSLVPSIFHDFLGSFDCVYHIILLKKLLSYSVRGVALNWLRSYLSDREQYLYINEEISESRLLDCGVLQGSILGILCFFFIFLNDFPNSSSFFEFTSCVDVSTFTEANILLELPVS